MSYDAWKTRSDRDDYDGGYEPDPEPTPEEERIDSEDELQNSKGISRNVLKSIIVLLCGVSVLMGFYAFRQRAWADKLHDQLVQTNLDDVKLMKLLTPYEKLEISLRFRDRGEDRIADWIEKQ